MTLHKRCTLNALTWLCHQNDFNIKWNEMSTMMKAVLTMDFRLSILQKEKITALQIHLGDALYNITARATVW